MTDCIRSSVVGQFTINRSWQIAIFPLLLLLYNISSLVVQTYGYIITVSTEYEPREGFYDAIVAANLAATITINIYATCK